MTQAYAISEAKAKFSEVIRRVRAGRRITITQRGKAVAEILPILQVQGSLKERLKVLEARGVLSRSRKPTGKLTPFAKRPGALARFLKSRR